MKRSVILLAICSFIFQVSVGQEVLTIPQIQGSGSSSSYVGQRVKTSGVVTAVFIGNNRINGFFLQDPNGDNNANTSDGIFVYAPSATVSVGDKILLVGSVKEYYNKTQLYNIANVETVATSVNLPPTKIVYNSADNAWDWERYEGMLVEFDQRIYVNAVDKLEQSGELELGDIRMPVPTNLTLPGSDAYQDMLSRISRIPFYMDDGYKDSYHTPIFFQPNGVLRRTGEKIRNLTGVMDYSYSKNVLYPTKQVNFYGNSRPTKPDDVGNTNLRVCAFNLEFFLVKNIGKGYGASNQMELDRQSAKIVSALVAIDADVYGLLEIEQGQVALQRLADDLNRVLNISTFTYVNDGGTATNTYTKVGYLYRSDRVTPHLDIRHNNSPSPRNRKKSQAFTLNENGEIFIFSLNHFKSKRCSYASGADADQNDGQNCYNARRVEEATSTLRFTEENKSYYNDDDVLIMGDLNAYAKEDPIITFTNGGYTDLHQYFHSDTAYSYVYGKQAGYIDHALASPSLLKQTRGVTVFHINADEDEIYGYKGSAYAPNMYRCSDHDPVVVGLRLGNVSAVETDSAHSNVKIYPTVVAEVLNVSNAENGYIQLYNMSGIKCFEHSIDTANTTFDRDEISVVAGAYIVNVLHNGRITRDVIFIK